MGRYEEAIECYDISIFYNHGDLNPYYEKGNTLKSMGKKKEALDCYEKAISLNPGHKDALQKKSAILNEIAANKKKKLSKRENQKTHFFCFSFLFCCGLLPQYIFLVWIYMFSTESE